MRTLAEILEVADDAQLEGRTSTVNHNAIVEAAGTLRRIANRLASIATGRIVTPTPPLDPVTESAREAVLDAIRRQLQSWLDFFSGADSLSRQAPRRSRKHTHPMTWQCLSSSSDRGLRSSNLHVSNRGLSTSGAQSSLNCTRCAVSNTLSRS